MRRFCVLVIALALSACGPPPTDGIEIVTNGETPRGPTPATMSSSAAQKPTRTIALPPPTGGIGDIKLRKLFNEAIRLSSFMVPPTVIDPRFLGKGGVTLLYRKSEVDVAMQDYGYITGVSVSRRQVDNSGMSAALTNDVWIFHDEASAAAATEALFRLRDEKPDHTKRVRTVEIPGFPEAKAYSTRTGEGRFTYTETTAHLQRGPFVVQIEVGRLNEEESIDIIARSLTKQVTGLEGFTPTPVDQLSSLDEPYDPDGSLLKLVSDKNSFSPSGIGGVFDTKGALLFQGGTQPWPEVYRQSGVDRLIIGESNRVTRAADDVGAARLLNDMRAEFASRKDYEPTSTPATVPNADCRQYESTVLVEDPLLACLFQQGRYVAWVEGKQSVIGQRVQDQRNRLG